MVNLDADDPADDSDSDSGDSDDDTAILMAELNKIKAEKQQEAEEKVIISYFKFQIKRAPFISQSRLFNLDGLILCKCTFQCSLN